MDYLPRNRRLWELDYARGLYLCIIVIAHSIFFFHTQTNPLLRGINTLADTISFTGLLCIAGATAYISYLHPQAPPHTSRILKRVCVYLAGYYLLASIADILASGFSYLSIFQIITFQKLIPFTEFFIAFIVFAFLKIPLRPILRHLMHHPLKSTGLGLVLFVIGTFLSTKSLPIPQGWQAILVGKEGWYSFPIFQYAIVYMLGGYIGAKLFAHTSKSHKRLLLLNVLLTSLIVPLATLASSLILGFSLTTAFQRFPPSLAFISLGMIPITFLLLLFQYTKHLYQISPVRILLLIAGQNTFSIYVIHTLILYLYLSMGFPKVDSTILIVVLFFISTSMSIYAANIIPFNYRFTLSFIDWCECEAGLCHHRKHHQLALTKYLSLLWPPNAISFTISNKTYRPLRLRHLSVAIIGILLMITPLGIAEQRLILQAAFSSARPTTNRQWIIPSHSPTISVEFSPPPEMAINQGELVVQVNHQQIPLHKTFDTWIADIPTDRLPIGTHDLFVEHLPTGLTSSAFPITISYPVFTTWTIDWEGYDVADDYLDALIDLSTMHQIPMTHLFNPRIYTSPDINPTRAQYLTEWVQNRQQLHGEEIGLHLHMFPDFISQAGLTPKQNPAWGGGFSPGYDILTTTYDADEFTKILEYAKSLFAQKGLPQPRSYRAGAWFANSDTLAALDRSGFLVDSSARTKYVFGTTATPGYWDISITADPYHPSQLNQNSHLPPPNHNLLEIPNNGADSFAFSGAEMIARFQANYQGGISSKPTQVTFLSHPHWFKASRQQAMHQVFTHINQYRYDQDRGPVIPVLLIDVYRYWTESQ